MKIVTPKEMARIESLAYAAGYKDTDFMNCAGEGVAKVANQLISDCSLGKKILLLCGKGNNSGDAYVAGTYLYSIGYHVDALQLIDIKSCSPLCQREHKRFLEKGGKVIHNLSGLDQYDLIIDGLFGTGFHGKIQEPYSQIIETVNNSEIPILSVDIPSGLNGETGEVNGPAIKASVTVYLGLPKTGFFLNEGWNHVGTLRFVDFGLPESFIEQADSHLEMIVPQRIHLPKMDANRHKYQAGLVVGLAGSPGMPGAAILSSLASLRSGAGIVRLLHPEGMQHELSNSPYELIRIPYESSLQVIEHMNKAQCTFIGPGLGRGKNVLQLTKDLLDHVQVPIVIDADALHLIAQENLSIPKNAVLTPHTGECARLLGNENSSIPNEKLLFQCQHYVEEHKTTLVLKGGPTFIFHPNEKMLVCPRGTPGLATAGSGDVLTGVIAAFASQGLTPYEAAITGVYLHAAAGEHAAIAETPYGMIASDIIDYLAQAFKEY